MWGFFLRGGADKLTEKLMQQKTQKLKDEAAAFAETPVEDIEFVVGAGNFLLPVTISMSILVIRAVAGDMLKDVFIGNGLPEQKEAITSVLFGGSWLLLSVILFLHAMLRPKMGILGRNFYYKKMWYSCDQIWEIRITRLSRIILYMEGKRFASYSWDESNAEKLIAWARKCGVSVRDDRNPIGNNGGEDVFFLRDLFTKDLFGKNNPAQHESSADVPAPKQSAPPPEQPREIADNQFRGNTELTEYTLPHGVTRIGRDAFAKCKNLEKVTLLFTLTEIDSQAFDECTSLREIQLPDSVRKLGYGAFYECKSLKSFRFPKGLRGAELENGLFYRCTSLETVELPDKLSGTFGSVFSHCESLREVHLPEGIAQIGSFAFEGCNQLKTVVIPSTVRILEYKAFIDMESLEEMYIPDNVRIIDALETFAYCPALKKIRLPLGVTFRRSELSPEIQKDAVARCFYESDALETVILGDTEFKLDGPFNDRMLERFYAALAAEGITPETRPPAPPPDIPFMHKPKQQTYNTGRQTEITKDQYSGRTDLTEFIVPEGVKKIGSWAFRNCVNLERVILPDSLTEIGDSAFGGCKSLREIRIPEGVKKIGDHAFAECSLLQSFRFPQSMRGAEISSSMFYCCLSLETVKLPENVSGDFSSVFSHCDCLRNVRLPEGITKIGPFTFQCCDLPRTVEIPSTVTSISYKAFVSARGLEEIYIPDSVKEIDAFEAFGCCTALKKIRLPLDFTFTRAIKKNKLEPENDDDAGYCFNKCISLKTVILGDREFTLEGPLNDAALKSMYEQL